MTKIWIDMRGVILLILGVVLVFTMMNCNVKQLDSANNSANLSNTYEK